MTAVRAFISLSLLPVADLGYFAAVDFGLSISEYVILRFLADLKVVH